MTDKEVFLSSLPCLLSQQCFSVFFLEPRGPYHCLLWGWSKLDRHLEEAACAGDKTPSNPLGESKGTTQAAETLNAGIRFFG